MNRLHLLSTVAASLMLAVGTAAAQQASPNPTGRAPAAQQKAPAEKMAPPMHAGQQHGSSTTGQGSQGMSSHNAKGKATTNGQGSSSMSAGEQGQMQKGPKASNKMHKNGQAQMNKNEKTGANEKNKNRGMNAKGESGMSQKSATSGHNRATSGQGAAGTHAKLSSQQRTKITTIIKNRHVRPAHVNFSVRVGARVPTSVHFYPLPTEVIQIYPQWRGYDYILVSDQILIISPRTHEIVAVLPA